MASAVSPSGRKAVCAENCLGRRRLCRPSDLVLPPHQRLRLVPSWGEFSVTWGAVRWHAGIAASSPGMEREIFTITDSHHRPPPPAQLNEIALVALIRKSEQIPWEGKKNTAMRRASPPCRRSSGQCCQLQVTFSSGQVPSSGSWTGPGGELSFPFAPGCRGIPRPQ